MGSLALGEGLGLLGDGIPDHSSLEHSQNRGKKRRLRLCTSLDSAGFS